MNKKGQAGFIIGIIAIFLVILALGFTLYKFGVFGTGLQFADGYTQIGSDLRLTDSTASDSKYWGPYGMIDQTSTDENFIFKTAYAGGGGLAESCTHLKESLQQRKVRLDASYSLAPTNSGVASFQVYAATYSGLNFINQVLLYEITARETGQSQSILIETIPELFSNKTTINVGGEPRLTFNNDKDMQLRFCTNSGGKIGASSSVTLKNTRYQPLLNCQKKSSDLLAVQNFGTGSKITLNQLDTETPFAYTPDQFCQESIIQKGDSSGGTYEIIDKIIDGGSYIVPEDTVITMFYYFDNSQGIVSVICEEGEAINEFGVCQEQTGIAVPLTQGTLDVNSNVYVTQPETICENLVGIKATWEPDPADPTGTNGTCVAPSPIIAYPTESGTSELRTVADCNGDYLTYDADVNACVVRVENLCIASGQGFDSIKNVCISLGSIDVDQQRIESPSSYGKYILFGTLALFVIIMIIFVVIYYVK